MKTKLITVSIMIAAITMVAMRSLRCQEPQWKWVKTSGNATIISSASDTLGNVVSIGTFTDSTLRFGNVWVNGSPYSETSSMYVVKYNSAGGIMWAQSVYGTISNSQVEPVKVVINEHGEIGVLCKIKNTPEIIMGKYIFPLESTEEKLLVFTIAKTGRIIWVRMFRPVSFKIPEVTGTDIVIDRNGTVYCTGYFTADTLFVGHEYIVGEDPATFLFVSRFSPFGALDWIRTCPFEAGAGYTQIYSRFLIPTLDGILIAGEYQGDRDYYFNASIIPGDSSTSAYVAKISYTGDFIWAKRFGGNMTDFIDGLSTDMGGNAYVTGISNSFMLSADTCSLINFSGAHNLFVSKLNPEGGIEWLKDIDIQLVSFNNPGKNSFLMTDMLGNITLVTHYMGASVLSNANTRPNAMEGTRDLLALRLNNEDGSIQWVHSGNAVSDDWLSSVTFDRFGSTYILGSLLNDMTYESITFADAAGFGGFYIVKISYSGDITFGRANFNGADGYLTGQRILADPYGNLYLQGSFSGVANMLGDLLVNAVENNGLFVSKFSYMTNISGHVWNPDGSPMPGGMVKVYGFTRFQRSPLSDSTLINANGEYYLKDIPYGRYIIYANPDLGANPDVVPTYYPSASNWVDANPIMIRTSEPLIDIDIFLKEVPVITGTSALGGLVFESDTTNIFKSSFSIQAKPVRKANVVLVGKAKSNDNVIAYTTTDDFGNFAFYDISDGGYIVIVDIPGMPHESYYDVTVTGGQLIMNLDHLVGEETILAQYGTNGLPSNSPIETLSVYPNPSTGMLFIQNPGMPSEMLQVEIFSLTGACLFKKTINLNTGINTLDIGNIHKGIYLLKMNNATIQFHEKLFIQ
ncbi:MAG: T9SS type A sorting domain-containing protein [Bacteroidales bacterium]|nr:T9SS type A sorting domain-containing protein [Bacteroidales bacterium]